MEQNKKTQKELLIQKQFQSLLKSHSERMARTEEFVKSFQKSISGVLEISREERENDKQKLLTYLEASTKKLEDSTLQEGLIFLQTEKKGFEVKIIKANISKDGYAKKFYQVVINEILNPLISMQNEIVLQEKEISTLTLIEDNHTDTDVQKSKNKVLEKPDKKLPEGFRQIECDASKSEILEYFNILSKEINRTYNEPYMTTEDITFLVEKNFKIFGKEPYGGYVKINLGKQQKIRLKYFMFQFYEKYAAVRSRPKKDYANFLIWNFELFQFEKPEILVTNMGETKGPKGANRIPVEKFLKS